MALPDDLAQRLEEIARRENRPVAEVIAAMVEGYTARMPSEEEGPDWSLIVGVFDDDVTDMSTTVRETLHEYFHKRYSRSD